MLPIMLVLLAYIIGIIGGLYLNFILSVVFFCLFIGLELVFRKNKLEIILLIFFLLGNFLTIHLVNKYDNKYQDGPFELIGKIISEREEKEYYDQYLLQLENRDKFLLYLEKGREPISYGSKVEIQGNFELPSQKRNYGGFDYRRYLNTKGIYGTIRVRKKDCFIVQMPKGEWLEAMRQNIKKNLHRLLPEEEFGLLYGMLIGDTSYLEEDILESFQRSGVTHLLAVSGTNINYILLLTQFFLKRLFSRKGVTIGIIVTLLIFTMLTGASASVLRASLMVIILLGADFFMRKNNSCASLSTTCLILLIGNPFYLYDVGFLLSFLGTLGILLLHKKIYILILRRFYFPFFVSTLSITIAAQIVLLPIFIYYFHSIAIFSILSNLFLAPLAGAVILLGFLCTILSNLFFPFAKILSLSLYCILSFIITISRFVSQIPIATWQVATPNGICIFGYYIFWMMLFQNKPRKKEKMMALFFIIGMFFLIQNLPRDFIKIHFIDVGQGDACYIETNRNRSILIDGGGSESTDYDVGQKILLPYLFAKGRSKIDFVIVSHAHKDHIDGILTVAQNRKIGQIIISDKIVETKELIQLMEIAKQKRIEVVKVKKGDIFYLDDICFEVLHPKEKTKDANHNSLVLRMHYGGKNILYTGDVEALAEQEIIKEITFQTTILKVAHHGSKTSSTEDFIEKVRPQIACISVGKNSFGHPSSEVIQRLEKLKTKIMQTKEKGEIEIILKNTGKIKIKTCLP